MWNGLKRLFVPPAGVFGGVGQSPTPSHVTRRCSPVPAPYGRLSGRGNPALYPTRHGKPVEKRRRQRDSRFPTVAESAHHQIQGTTVADAYKQQFDSLLSN